MRFGPLHIAAFEFGPDAKFEARILDELEQLGERGVVRLVDLLVVHRESDGSLVAVDLPGDNAVFGGILGALLGFDFDGEGPDIEVVTAETYDNDFGLRPDDFETFVSDIPIGSTVAVILLEHSWVHDLREAILDAGGRSIGNSFLSGDAVDTIADEVVAMVEALEQAQERGMSGARG